MRSISVCKCKMTYGLFFMYHLFIHLVHRASLVSPVSCIRSPVIWNSTFPKITRPSTHSVNTQPPLVLSNAHFFPSISSAISCKHPPTHSHPPIHTPLTTTHSVAQIAFISASICDSRLKDENLLERILSFSLSYTHTHTHTISLFLSQHTNWICGLDRARGQRGRIKITSLRTLLHKHILLTQLHTHTHTSADRHSRHRQKRSFTCIRYGNRKALNHLVCKCWQMRAGGHMWLREIRDAFRQRRRE